MEAKRISALSATHRPVPVPLPPVIPEAPDTAASAKAPPRSLPLAVRWLLMAFAALCIVLGVIGIFLPGMPTTVFILMAAWASMRSSPRFHGWITSHPRFGPMVRAWEDGGRVSRRVKWMATATMSVSSVAILFFVHPDWLKASVLVMMSAVLGWLWCRPE